MYELISNTKYFQKYVKKKQVWAKYMKGTQNEKNVSVNGFM